MIDVYFVRDGSKIRVQAREGLSAMEAAKFESPVDIPEIPEIVVAIVCVVLVTYM